MPSSQFIWVSNISVWIISIGYKLKNSRTHLPRLILFFFFLKYITGVCGENTSKKLSITRKQQDDFATLSYKRAQQATDAKLFDREMVPITIKGKRGKPDIVMSEDEEIRRANFDKFSSLPTVFDRTNGTITAANASKFLILFYFSNIFVFLNNIFL